MGAAFSTGRELDAETKKAENGPRLCVELTSVDIHEGDY